MALVTMVMSSMRTLTNKDFAENLNVQSQNILVLIKRHLSHRRRINPIYYSPFPHTRISGSLEWLNEMMIGTRRKHASSEL